MSTEDGEMTDEAGLSDRGRDILHDLMDTALALGCGATEVAAWNAAVKAEHGETAQALIKRLKAAQT